MYNYEEPSKAYKMVVRLFDEIKQMKLLFRWRWIEREEKHAKELNVAKEQLTTNSNLWE